MDSSSNQTEPSQTSELLTTFYKVTTGNVSKNRKKTSIKGKKSNNVQKFGSLTGHIEFFYSFNINVFYFFFSVKICNFFKFSGLRTFRRTSNFLELQNSGTKVRTFELELSSTTSLMCTLAVRCEFIQSCFLLHQIWISKKKCTNVRLERVLLTHQIGKTKMEPSILFPVSRFHIRLFAVRVNFGHHNFKLHGKSES